MPEYLSPGVYVEEVETGAVSIEGVSTSTVGFLGETERGPDEPQFLSSFADFKRAFGGFAKYRRKEPMEGTNLAYAVDGFFRNGGSRCYVGRVTSATETADVSLGAYEAPTRLVTDEDEVDFDGVVVGRTATETVEFEHPGFEKDPAIDVSVSVEGTQSGDTPGEFDVRLIDGDASGETVAASESIFAEVSYAPSGDGAHAASLTVEHDGTNETAAVRLAGEGETAADAAEFALSTDVVDFGTVPTGAEVSRTVTVTNAGPEGADPVEISGVALDSTDQFAIVDEASLSFPIAVGTDGRQTFEVAVDNDAVEGLSATLEITHDGSQSPAEVALRGNMVEPANTLGSSVHEVAFGEVVTTTTAERTIALRNMGSPDDEDLTITDVAPTSSVVDASLLSPSAEPTLAPGESVPLRLEFEPATTNDDPGAVDVEYDDESGTGPHELTVGAGATVVEEGSEYLARPAAEENLPFGDVVVGETATRTVVLSNDAREGGSDVTIEGVELRDDDGEFSYSLPAEYQPEADPIAELAPGETLPVTVTATPADANLTEATLEVTFDADEGPSSPQTYDLSATGVDSIANVRAVGPGAWGDRVAVTVRNGARSNETFRVTVRYWSDLDDDSGSDADVVAARDDPDVEETFGDLVTEESSSNYYETVINSGSNLVEVEPEGAARPSNGTVVLGRSPDAVDEETEHDEVAKTHYNGSEAEPRGERTGLAGLAEIDDVSIVTVPDERSIDGLTSDVVSHCENEGDRVAVLQTSQGADPADLPPDTAISEYAAVYYPHIRIVDPETGRRKLVPPGGHVAGIYARSDTEHGVWKAPANETVRGAVELEFPVSKADQARLNPKGVNAIRSFPGRGIRVWGARTTSANPQWKYVNVRRLFLYIEESIDEGTQWAVFESNTEDLWARVRQSVRNFLTTVWREGGLAGSTPEEAFYVKADRTTMTQSQIDNGQLIVEIGVAPVKPAEFVIFRISQWTEGLEGGS